MPLPKTPLEGGLAGDDNTRHALKLRGNILIGARDHLVVREDTNVLATCSQEQD